MAFNFNDKKNNITKNNDGLFIEIKDKKLFEDFVSDSAGVEPDVVNKVLDASKEYGEKVITYTTEEAIKAFNDDAEINKLTVTAPFGGEGNIAVSAKREVNYNIGGKEIKKPAISTVVKTSFLSYKKHTRNCVSLIEEGLK